MSFRKFPGIVLVLFLFLFTGGETLAEEGQLPAPIGDIYVQDFANVLSEQERAELIQIGGALEDRTTAQVAVLTVETIGEQTIEQFANEAFRQYGIGGAETNNGVLLVMSTNDRLIKIEVGYGLEGRIPDGKAGRILDQYAIPFLQNQQHNRAIIETYKALTNEVLAEYGETGLQTGEAVPQPQPQPQVGEGSGIPSWLLIIIVVVVIFLDFKFFGGTLTYLMLSILSRSRGGGGGGGPRGGGGGSSGGGGASRGW